MPAIGDSALAGLCGHDSDCIVRTSTPISIPITIESGLVIKSKLVMLLKVRYYNTR